MLSNKARFRPENIAAAHTPAAAWRLSAMTHRKSAASFVLFLFLTVCLTVPVSASSEGETSSGTGSAEFWLDGKRYDSGTGWNFDSRAGVLTLDGFTGDMIDLYVSGDMTLELARGSVNTLTSKTWGPWLKAEAQGGGGTLTIRGGGTLTICLAEEDLRRELTAEFRQSSPNATKEEEEAYWQECAEHIYQGKQPFFQSDVPVKLDGVVLRGGARPGDRESLTFRDGCARTADGTSAAYVEISPAASHSTDSSDVLSGFEDVLKGSYYADAVAWAVEHGITKGVSSKAFAPDTPCTRGQVATFLWRSSGCPEPALRDNPFADVDPSSAFCKAILWAYEQGITSGRTANLFAPGDPCTRAHVITFLWRMNGRPAARGNSTLANSLPKGYYTEAVAWADTASNVLRTTGEPFTPSALCPRSDIVYYLNALS